MLVKAWAPAFAQKAQKPVKVMSAVFLVLVILAAIYQERNTIVRSMVIAGPAALLLNISGMLLGYYIPRLFNLPWAQQITISIETSIQNGTLAIAIASSPLMLGNATMAIPAVVYSLIMFITAGLFISLVNRRKTKLATA
jgi:BASS family bile acid:Na+ symporter